MGHAMHMADGDESGIVHLLADDAEGGDHCFPGGINGGVFIKQGECRLKRCSFHLCRGS